MLALFVPLRFSAYKILSNKLQAKGFICESMEAYKENRFTLILPRKNEPTRYRHITLIPSGRLGAKVIEWQDAGYENPVASMQTIQTRQELTSYIKTHLN